MEIILCKNNYFSIIQKPTVKELMIKKVKYKDFELIWFHAKKFSRFFIYLEIKKNFKFKKKLKFFFILLKYKVVFTFKK